MEYETEKQFQNYLLQNVNQYIIPKLVQSKYSIQRDRQTKRHEVANNSFSQLCKGSKDGLYIK